MSETITLSMMPHLVSSAYRENLIANTMIYDMEFALKNHLDSIENGNIFSNTVYRNTDLTKLLNRELTTERYEKDHTENAIGETSYDLILNDGNIAWSPFIGWKQKVAVRLIDFLSKHSYLNLYQNYITPNNTIGDLGFLNTLSTAGLRVQNGKKISLSLLFKNSSSSLTCNTVIIDVAKGANLNLLEVHDSADTSISKIIYIVRDGAKLSVDRYIKKGDTAHVIESKVVQFQKSKVVIDVHCQDNDFTLQSFDVESFHYCSTSINGKVISKNSSSNTVIANVQHRGVDSKSYIDVKSVCDNNGLFNFKGCVTIEQQAVQTVAHMQNKNLQLSKNAKVFTEPTLDIATKEVECSHGCTISNIDEDELYYLQSKGIDADQSRKILINNFLGTVDNEELIPYFV